MNSVLFHSTSFKLHGISEDGEISAEYEKLIVSEDMHKRTLVKIPTPHFVVFFNGTEKCAERQELRLKL